MYQHTNNYLSGDQSLQVLKYQLVISEQTEWNLSIGIPTQPKDTPTQVETLAIFDRTQYIHVESAAS